MSSTCPSSQRQRTEHRHLPVALALQVGDRAADANVDRSVAREQPAQRGFGAIVQRDLDAERQLQRVAQRLHGAERADRPLLISARRSTRCWISARMCELRITVVPPLAQLGQDPVELADAFRIEAVGRLVEEQDARRPKQRLREREPLPHAFRIRAHRLLRDVAEPDLLKQRATRPGLRALQSCEEAHRFEAAQVVVQRDALRQIADAPAHAPERPARTDSPSIRTSPAVGASSPSISLNNVVLPAPL